MMLVGRHEKIFFLQWIVLPASPLQDVAVPGAGGHDPAAGAGSPAGIEPLLMEVSDALHWIWICLVSMTGLTTHYFGLCNV